MGMITINGTELEFDLFDADVIEKYEDGNEKVLAKMKDNTLFEGKSTADCMRVQCGIIDGFFDEVFGDGTAQKIFNKPWNLRERIYAFEAVAEESQKCGQEVRDITDKYTANRAQRRQPKQNGGNKRRQFYQNNGKQYNS